MNWIRSAIPVYVLTSTIIFAQQNSPADESYPEHPDSLQKEHVPQGRVLQSSFANSKIFPGTSRDYWVYIPDQYDSSSPAALMVFQDGGGYARRNRGFRVPNVFDNLIHAGEMPVTVALCINPGVVKPSTDSVQARLNRSFEYDSMDDRYARFLIEEMIPLVVQKYDLKLSDDPDDRGICGSSSGGICAFNVAWHRPDTFRRVFTTIGTYVGLRGGESYSTLVRKTEPKPLRIFLQDGSNDLNTYGGDWWLANQAMLRSLQWAGYEVHHEFGEGPHSGKHGIAIFPDVMRWLWKDHGKVRVSTHLDRSKSEATTFLVDGEDWEVVSHGHQWAEGLAVTDDGTLYFTDVHASELYKVSPGGDVSLVVTDTGRANGLALGIDGKLYGASGGAQQIRAWDLETMEMEVVSAGTFANDIVVRHDGTIYYTDPREGKIWVLDKQTRQRRAAASLPSCNGIGLNVDQTQLFVADFSGRFIYSYIIAGDGSLTHGQPYFHMEVPTNDPPGRLDGLCSTADGWLVATSQLGVQICDQLGRSHLIMPIPPGSQRPCYVTFGGTNNQTLYVANVDKVLKRKTQMVGAKPWQKPVKSPRPPL